MKNGLYPSCDERIPPRISMTPLPEDMVFCQVVEMDNSIGKPLELGALLAMLQKYLN